MVEKITIQKNKELGGFDVVVWNNGKPDYVLARYEERFDAQISARLFRSEKGVSPSSFCSKCNAKLNEDEVGTCNGCDQKENEEAI